MEGRRVRQIEWLRKGQRWGRGRETPRYRGRGWFGRGDRHREEEEASTNREIHRDRENIYKRRERKDSKDLEFRERHPWRDRKREKRT